MFPIKEWFSSFDKEKTADWADRIITYVRLVRQPLISADEANLGMQYLLDQQDMSFIKALFQNTARINLTNSNGANVATNTALGGQVTPQNKEDKNLLAQMRSVEFIPLPIWEKYMQVLIAEMKKMGPVVNVRSEDPTSTSKKIQDKGLLDNRANIESMLSYIYSSMGQQPYKMEEHEARFGQKPSKGNIEQFDAMGLDSNDPSDVNFFMENFHKLDEEICVQNIIDYISSYNRWTMDIEKWVRDIIAKKAVAATCYVSDVTGAIMTRYLAPETVYIYGGGNWQDFNDAYSKSYERKMTIKEMLDLIGDAFDMGKEFDKILQAVTFTSNIEFTGIHPSWISFSTGNERLTGKDNVQYGYSDFLAFRVTIGYIEWTTQNEEVYEGVKSSGGYYEDNQPSSKYPSKAKWETPTYKAYYLAISSVSQILFDFGKLSYQDILGATDFNSNFTIVTYKEVGQSLAVKSKQLIDMINEAWYKFRYEIRRAKPRGRGWNYDSMISSLMNLIPDTGISEFNKLQKVMELLDSSANEIYAFPLDKSGKQMPMTGAQLNYDIPGGMSKESMVWWQIMMSGLSQLSEMMGMAPLREGDPGNARDSMNNQFKALEYSQAATWYIPDMLTILFQQLSVKANFYAQDIILYDEKSLAYKFLQDAVGDETINKLKKLGKTGLHRFGIFIESLNQAPLRQKLEMVMTEAIKNKTITTAQYLLCSDIKSVKKAFLTFAYFEQKNAKMAQQQQQQIQQAQQQAAAQQQQALFAIEKMKANTELTRAKIMADSNIQAHITNQQGGIAKKAMEISADKEDVYLQAKQDLQQPLAPPPPVAPPAYTPQQPQQGMGMPRPESRIQQLRDSIEPAPTSASPDSEI